jgi:hypothetical protein
MRSRQAIEGRLQATTPATTMTDMQSVQVCLANASVLRLASASYLIEQKKVIAREVVLIWFRSLTINAYNGFCVRSVRRSDHMKQVTIAKKPRHM